MNVLNSHSISSPILSQSLVLVVGCSESLLEVLNVLVVFLSGVHQCNCGSCLLVNQFAESGLAFDEAEGHSLLSAESWEEDHHFDGVHIVSNHN